MYGIFNDSIHLSKCSWIINWFIISWIINENNINNNINSVIIIFKLFKYSKVWNGYTVK